MKIGIVGKSRYIDANEALRMMRNSKQDCPLNDDKRGIWYVAHDCTISCVEAVPTADVVEVVRCEECAHGQCQRNGVLCEFDQNGRLRARDGFCSSGERREEK